MGKSPPQTGPAVDAGGNRAFDPSANVLALVEAAGRRTDDLAAAHNKCEDEKIQHLREIAVLREEHAKEIRRLDSDRLEKIRQVDVANAAATAAQLLSAVQTLASTKQATDEALRNQVAATAASVASQTERLINPIVERVAMLEKSSYTGQGRAGVAEPQFAELLAEMKSLNRANSSDKGVATGTKDTWGYVAGGLGILIAIVTYQTK